MMAYAIVLRKHLMVLKSGKDDFKTVMGTFNQAVNQASQTIQELKNVAQKEQTQMTEKIDRALSMCEELEFLIGRSETLVSEMEKISQKTPSISQKKPSIEPVQTQISSAKKTIKKELAPHKEEKLKPELKATIDDIHDELKIFKMLQNIR
ncbi:MAG: hypothetical protein J0G29_07645 [Alphaproteobacteria bacterium]|nr:hypothetical protein [Alphaproteobacteria bacterium]